MDSMTYDHRLERLVDGGALAVCGERAYAGHPLMFGTGKRGASLCPECFPATDPALGKTMPAFSATAVVGKRMADGTVVG